MISAEDEKKRYCEATKCTTCIHWHKHCNAECCRSITLNIGVELLSGSGKYVSINPGKIGMSDIRYFAIHDVDYVRGLLRFRRDRIKVVDGRVVYFYTCQRLKDNLCMDHPYKKPDICKSLTLESSKMPNEKFVITPNCLFKYKNKEVKKNG